MKIITMSDSTRIVIHKSIHYQYYKRIAFSGPLPWILVRAKGSNLEYFATEEEVIKWIEKQ